MRVHEIRGIQASVAERLAAEGLKTAEALLAAGRTPAGRNELAAKVGADVKEILELINWANLARVRGIGEVYSNLLELARRNAANLPAALIAQTQTGDARRTPTLAQVEDWVAQARNLGRGIEYQILQETGFLSIGPPSPAPVKSRLGA